VFPVDASPPPLKLRVPQFVEIHHFFVLLAIAILSPRLSCVNTVSMSSSAENVITQKKKRGPAPTGKGTLIGVRLQPPELTAIDEWRSDLSRPEAIRRLMALGLKAKRKRGR
jgi:hypothetical protein